MLPGNPAVSQIQQYIRAQQGVIEVGRVEAGQPLLLTVGERVQATVTGQLPNGRFAVLVKDQLLDLNLPSNTQPGEQLDLTVLAKDPRLTFSLSSPQANSTPAPSANGGVAFSKTAQLLAELSAKPEGQTKVATLQQSQPLFEGTPDTKMLATQLATRLTESGLFYESHQAEWVSGDRQLQSLLREPQAKLPLGAQLSPPAVTSDVAMPRSVAGGAAEAVSRQSVSTTHEGDQSAPQSFSSQSVEVLQRTLPSALPESAPRHLVRQQLALLENHPLVWAGQAWPGQAMHWKTELQNEGHAETGSVETGRVWQTRLDLALPRLGQLGVAAVLRDGQFSLRFDAENPATVALLQQKLSDLNRQFDAAGLQLTAAQVFHHVNETDENA